jgi:predicted nucleic acid-binding protein
MPADPMPSAAIVVIDTQSLFDWLVFRDPACSGWSAMLDDRQWKWIFTFEMRAEFDHVAAKGFGERWPVSVETCADAWSRHGRIVDVPAPLGADRRLACSDPDDQKFIDLAIAAGADTLVSRDKALLKLARRARERHGLRVCTPAAWSAGLAIAG